MSKYERFTETPTTTADIIRNTLFVVSLAGFIGLILNLIAT